MLVAVTVSVFLLLVGAAAVVRRVEPSPLPGPGGQTGSASPSGLPSATTGGGASPSDDPTAGASPGPTALVGPTGDPILIGAGDIADCGTDGDEATAGLLDALPGTVFTTGDNVYEDGTPQEFAECYAPTWGRHLARTRPAPGNHDWGTDALGGYLGYFGAAATGPGGVSWYAYDLGTWRVVVLDSSCDRVGGCGPESPQGRWLAADLAASSARCTVAIFHHPRFSSGDRHGSDPTMDPLWRALYAADVDVVVNGHDHDYERFAPQDPDGNEDRSRGIRQFVVGTGGTGLRGFNDPVANSELRLAVAHGLLELTLRDGSYEWRFIPTSGDVSDRGTASCH